MKIKHNKRNYKQASKQMKNNLFIIWLKIVSLCSLSFLIQTQIFHTARLFFDSNGAVQIQDSCSTNKNCLRCCYDPVSAFVLYIFWTFPILFSTTVLLLQSKISLYEFGFITKNKKGILSDLIHSLWNR